jgi:hypothetical protein
VTRVSEPTGSAPLHRGVAELEAGRPVRALLDTAGTALCLSRALADELDLPVHEHLDDQGAVITVVEPPELRVGQAVLDTEGLVAYAFDDTSSLGLDARRADVLVPANVLRRHHVVLDEPAGTITVGPPGSLERRGVAVPATVDRDTGLVALSVEVEGELVDLLLDTAITSCLATDGLLRAWQGDHPDWPAAASAVGPGNMSGLPVEGRLPMLRVPSIQLGPFTVPQVAFTWRGNDDLDLDGALGGNVLRLFRLDLDYAAGSVRLEQGAPFPDNDTELVGVVLGLDVEGWRVQATISGLDDVRPGDVLVAVDGDPVGTLGLPEILDRLRGTPGDRHHLALRRDGVLVDVDAPVLRLL